MTRMYSIMLPGNEFLTLVVVIFLLTSNCDEPSTLDHEGLARDPAPVTDFFNTSGRGVRYRVGTGPPCQLDRIDVTDLWGGEAFDHLWEKLEQLQRSTAWLAEIGDLGNHTQ